MNESKKIEEMTQNENFYEHHHLIVAKGQNPIRLDKFLVNFLDHVSRNKVQKAAKHNCIRINGCPEKSNYKVKPGDEIKIIFEYPPHNFLLKPEALQLNIVYEDNDLIVVDKEAGMVVHPGHGNYTGTLINGILHHVALESNTKMPVNSDNRPGLVHRIDKDTSGLLVIAKTEKAMKELSKQLFHKSVEREYIALVWGDIKDDKGVIKGHIGRHKKNRLQMTVFEDGSYGKSAITHYKVIKKLGEVTLVSCKLETGRTHQIRVHMKYLGHTLFNDERYGGDNIPISTSSSKYKQFISNCFKTLPRQALHAHTLGFIHPRTHKFVQFTSELPESFKNLIDKWDNYFNSRIK